ncbi:MAG: HEAT repeat domain-containing protein [Actinobacteria bacterium]|nr:HEAT repeat domain-containing protein [Actinomycetota bacterium]
MARPLPRMTPRQRIHQEALRRGRGDVVAGCRALVRGERVDDGLVHLLGGPAASQYTGGTARDDDYWLRVWGLRGLLWQWDDAALPEIRLGLHDDAWRAREMALKVVARHRLDDLLDDVVALRDDAVPRVRIAADRALAVLATGR